jgi:hypothetical protein
MFCPTCGDNHLVRQGKADSGRTRWRCRNGHRTTQPLTNPTPVQSDLDLQQARKNTRFVVTCAQNDTPLHDKFFAALRAYAEANDAQLLVIPIRYVNPNPWAKQTVAQMTWPAEVVPYLLDRRLNVNSNLCIAGDIKLTATAADPLSGLDNTTGLRSAIIGHSQLQVRYVPTPHHLLPKMMHTTGTVSRKNYSSSKMGIKAEHHHTFAATVVEVEGKYFWTRELEADDSGGFFDLDAYYAPDGTITTGHREDGLVLGDEHTRHLDAATVASTFDGPGSLVGRLRPRQLVRHDVLDFDTRSHHHREDFLERFDRHRRAAETVEDEVQEVADHLAATTPAECTSVIVYDNHSHEHLRRWLSQEDGRRDPPNARFWFWLGWRATAAWEAGDYRDPFQIALDEMCAADLRWAGPNDRHLIGPYDCSQHGHLGANGARGSIKGFARASYKMIVGHGHSPGREKGAIQVGVTAIEQSYAKGLSSWLQTHAIVYPNGRATLISRINGAYWQGQCAECKAATASKDGGRRAATG